MKRPHYAPSAKCRHEYRCFDFSALWAFWALPCSPETARHWPSLVVTGKVGFLAVRTACQMYFPTNGETNDEW